ncbi:DUF4132 domain-containing protein [Actinomadura rudentiformis]|uniref:DUF4132 domain-containing protein n=1 Tax=Actinomadura rudentiformis TaxID=359158 RepID=A0A6H9Y634_9ACTN|nr:DUF4132 domain-containing protein [Actinomadura rudentiformis]KAB2339624.1 DUF4132 domain-containing protein [Actinomadura rudentiformis]
MNVADENVLVLPESWWRESHPRRGGRHVPDIEIDPAVTASVRDRVKECRYAIEAVLEHPETEKDLADRVRAYLDGAPDPAGAAAVAVIAFWRRWFWKEEEYLGLLDAWVTDHGVAFAACAFAEYRRIEVIEPPREPDRGNVIVVVAYAAGSRPGPSDIGIRYRIDGAAPDRRGSRWMPEDFTRQLRILLSRADDAEYAEAVKGLAEYRRSPEDQVLISYLVPAEQDWVDECCANHHELSMQEHLISSLGSPAQVDLIGIEARPTWIGWSPGLIASLVEGVGVEAVVSLLARVMEGERHYDDSPVLEALALLPTDAAFQALADRLDDKNVVPVVREAMRRFPVRAARLLAPLANTSEIATTLLTLHLLGDPGLLPRLPEETRNALKPIITAITRTEEAEAGDLPRLLVEPPWTRKRPKHKPFVLEGLTEPGDSRMLWEPGERERWAKADPRRMRYWSTEYDGDWQDPISRCRGEHMGGAAKAGLFAVAPEQLLRPLLSQAGEWDVAQANVWLPPLISRFELDALPLAMSVADSAPAAFSEVLLPFLDAEVAWVMADWLGRLKSAGDVARRWFERHGVDAVPLLLPAALDRPSDDRRNAENALRLLAAAHGPEAIIEAARVHGDEAAGAIGSMLATDPLELLPSRPPTIGAWADPGLLPPIHLRGRERVLPDTATRHVLEMLAMSKPGRVYAGLDTVREMCAPQSLAQFGWAVFQRWQLEGAPSKDNWALHQLGWLGDDDTVRRLAPLIRAWPRENLSARAVAGLDILAAIGSDVALLHLYGISQRMKFKALKARAQERIQEVAAALGLSGDQLADRAVPDFGLDADGSMTLDYGPRTFTVGFDEQLKPYVIEENGKHRKDLPKPAATDDATVAPETKKRFTALRKEVKAIAEGQIRQLEQAMVTHRHWSLEEFRTYLVGHPLMWHITRRLVWLADGTPFRLAEDRTFADVDDTTFEPPETARITVAHPLHLGEDLGTWSELFADYEILQPFPQLGRPTFALTPEERDSGLLKRFEGATAPYGKAKGLSEGRWSADNEASDGDWIARRAADHYVVVELWPGLRYGRAGEYPDQSIRTVWLADRPRHYEPGGEGPRRFGDLDPATVSEILYDLTRLTEAPPGS